MVVNVPTFSVLPNITLSELEKILEHLPEPTDVEVRLQGEFDYSDISRQARGAVAGMELCSAEGGVIFRLQNPLKEGILAVYRKSPELWARHCQGEAASRLIDLHRACWHLDDYTVRVELTPGEVVVKYKSQEPDYISRMKQELAGTKVRLRIEVVE